MKDNKSKFIALYRALQAGHPSGETTYKSLTEQEQADFAAFQLRAGAAYLGLLDELEQGLEELADVHPEETDPRKWAAAEWAQFKEATESHKFYEFYRTMAAGQNNIDLIWQELTNRL